MIVHVHRVSHWLWVHKIPILPWLLYRLIRLIFSAVLPPSLVLGRGVLLGYSGLGVVLHGRAVIGNRVSISQHVTIGGRSGLHGVPVVEDDVLIGAGAQILGPVRIGARAKVGANAVVLVDVPSGATAVGVPARILGSESE
jgi:serine O-acetyltransferase